MDQGFLLENEIGDDAAADVDPHARVPALGGTGALVTSALALAACSGGGGTGTTGGIAAGASPTPTPAPTPTPTAAAIGAVPASRFLAQATLGATRAEIASVQATGYDAWITAQFARPRATSHWDWLVANGYAAATYVNSIQGFDATLWRQMIVEPDQLRQRVGIALSEIMVIGVDAANSNWKQFNAAGYFDVLLDNAFGNFRTLIGAVTTNAAMGGFLTYLGNKKANATTGAVPDENYARELMQLFTLGLYQLNMDGTVKTAGSGAPLETYSQADVTGLARVFTGLGYASASSTTPDRYRVPMVMVAANHETGASAFLGTAIPAGTEGMAAINLALDAIFAHPNVPPFFARQLIQRLVTSNPSPAYVGRVAAAFANNGAGVRGDMKATIRAVLMDAEARADPSGAAGAGRLREPVTRLTNWARAFAVTSPSNAWTIGDTSSASTRLAQSIGHSATVFNFFRPGYTPPNTALSSAGLVAPEFQVTNELSVVAYVNYMQGMIANGIGDVKADYSAILTLSADSAALVDEINVLLAAGQLSAATVTAIRAAVDSIANTGTTGPSNRVMTAILLALAAPDYLTLK